MAIRAYFYSAGNNFAKMRDVSEYKNEIPFVYEILLSVDTQLIRSQLWENYPHPIAIQGDCKKGLERLYQLYDYLMTQPGFDKATLQKYKAETEQFFEANPDRILDVFFLEAGALYEYDHEITPIKDNIRKIYQRISSLGHNLDKLLSNPETPLQNTELSYYISGVEDIRPHWKAACYYTLNGYG